LRRLYEVDPLVVAGDLNLDFPSVQYGKSLEKPFFPVQHHHAHVAAVAAEHGLDGDVLGVSWDGGGLGPDGTLWGGEFLLASERNYKRVASFRPFRLPGGEKAGREPRRAAMGVLYEFLGEDLFRLGIPSVRSYTQEEWPLIRAMLIKNVNSPVTSSAGRLFDAVSSIIGLRQKSTYDGQAALELEFAADPGCEEVYPFQISMEKDGMLRLDWGPILCEVLNDFSAGVPAGIISARFHNALAELIVSVARSAGERRVALAGGCFQNRLLLERAARRLEQEGYWVYWNRRIPAGEDGLSLGQAVIAARQCEEGIKSR
jgi:hydrogenase maturation protein HypF